jgi:hypothetical protein
MPRYTEADFLAATFTAITNQRPRRNRHRHRHLTVAVPPPSQLRLPVASPSPFFDGMNKDINTEPFLVYIDDFPFPGKHCHVHCWERVCRKITKKNSHTTCMCREENKPKYKVSAPRFSFAARELEDEDLLVIRRHTAAHTTPDASISVTHTDAEILIRELEFLIADRMSEDPEFLAVLGAYWPNRVGSEDRIAIAIVEQFFNLVTLYLSRKFSPAATSLTITVQQLRSDLKVYAWTGFAEWLHKYCDVRTVKKVHAQTGRDSSIMEAANFGVPGAVSNVWLECLEDVVGFLVWRDEEVKRQKTCRFAVAVMAALVVFVCVVRGLGYW